MGTAGRRGLEWVQRTERRWQYSLKVMLPLKEEAGVHGILANVTGQFWDSCGGKKEGGGGGNIVRRGEGVAMLPGGGRGRQCC